LNWFVDFSIRYLGKTESAKYVLQYLTESYGSHSGQLEDRINKCKYYLIYWISYSFIYYS
jgi:hypothetical protein